MQWFFFVTIQFFLATKTWLTQDILYAAGIVPPQFIDDVLFKYHAFYTFCLVAIGMICFVLSLEEGFYAYQFKQMGWALLNMILISGAGHGLLVALWRLRIWFVYTLTCLYCRDIVDHFISNYLPIGPKLHSLAKSQTLIGYLFGGISAFAFYFLVSFFTQFRFIGC